MENIKITVIEGTDRPARRSLKVAKFIADLGSKLEGVEITFVDPKELNFSYEAGDPRYSEIVEESDAFLLVTPEYNHSFSGTLKTLLDTELKKYNHKAVAVAGVSAGPIGGARVVENILPVLRELGLVAISTNLYFPNVKDFFDENGEPKDPQTNERVLAAFSELIWMAKTLKWGRENL